MYSVIKYFFLQLLLIVFWILSLIIFIFFIVSIPLNIHLESKINQYKAIMTIVERTPLTEVGYLVNKHHIIEYNGWLAYWKHINKYPLIGLAVPDEINELKPITLKPWVSYSVPKVDIRRKKK